MKTTRAQAAAPAAELAGLRVRLAGVEETLRAIRDGEVDTVLGAGKAAAQVFTLAGAEHAYRVLIESMNEGALMLTGDMTILYANRCFARMIKCPLEKIIGSSLRRFLAAEDQAALLQLLQHPAAAGSKTQVRLTAGGGARLAVQISVRRLTRAGAQSATVSMVVTDQTESRRTEELLRALSHRLVQVQEAERGRLALELHDTITQMLCAVVVRSQTLADKLAARDGPARREAIKLCGLLGDTAEEVERISRNLRPGVLELLGLAAGLRDAGLEFAKRTGIVLKLACVEMAGRLPGDIELTLYRILQEVLSNVEAHASAHHVTLRLTTPGDFVQMVIHDDGVGFDPKHPATRRKDRGGLGLLGMRERASYVGGTLKIISGRRSGTTITVRIPLPP